MAILANVKLLSKELFGKYLLLTNNALTVGSVLLGDFSVRKMEKLFTGDTTSTDLNRTGRLCVFGMVSGTVFHYWYFFLDRVLPGRTARTVFKKILCDQVGAAPVANTLFLSGISLAEGQNFDEVKKQLKSKLLKVYLIDCCFWPSAQVINFYYLKPQYRMAYLNGMTYLWTCFLFYIQRKKVESKQT